MQAAIDAMGYGTFQTKVFAVVGSVYVADAMEMMILSFLGPAIRCSDIPVTPTQESSLTTAVFFGMMLGASGFGFLGDRYGRKRIILASSVLAGIAGLLSSMATSFYLLILSRAVVGVALGGGPVAYSVRAQRAHMCPRLMALR